MRIVATCSVPGGHPTNEDAYEIIRHPADEWRWIAALADGQGGQAGGGEAARLACSVVIEAVSAQPIRFVAAASTWVNAVRRADERVCAHPMAGYTTLIGFGVTRDHVIGAANGDSALWLADGEGGIIDLTAHQAKNPPIGCGGANPKPFSARLPNAWVVLAMSDGVWKSVGRERVAELLRNIRVEMLLDALLAEARLPWSGGLGDDFTAIVLESH
jgi:serine/threonine protein phosphatase PrpC